MISLLNFIKIYWLDQKLLMGNTQTNEQTVWCEISGSHSSEYEDYSDDGSSTHLWNVNLLQQDYTVLYPSKVSSSDSMVIS
jgi:hypothetical protein